MAPARSSLVHDPAPAFNNRPGPFDADTEQRLRQHGFDLLAFNENRARLWAGEDVFAANALRDHIEPLAVGEVRPLPAPGSAERDRLVRLGRRAIGNGEVGILVLAGGMATRFGGGVKAAVEVTDGRTFLDLKIADALRWTAMTGGRVPIFLLASFATVDVVTRLGAQAPAPVETLTQSVSVRLLADGALAPDSDGRPSLYAPGHGDVPSVLRGSGALARFRAAGGRLLVVSNVDNLVATLDPAIIGAHLAAGRPVSVEVVRKDPGDAGGAPARVGGVPQIVESFRFPSNFDQDRIPVFNTNTFVLDASALDREFSLTWFAVKKRADGRDVVQFERLLGEITAFLPTQFLEVPRVGLDSRFQPIKDPADLVQRAPEIRETLRHRGVLA